jgi:poly-gamma-glutamate synthesis protein (capsule biosynthesis protein)
VSVHWGPNWGYGVGLNETQFAHRLIDAGIDIVHGHSSHHPRPIEIYRGKPILYGCGDVINDYEGIGGYEFYRPDLRLLYLISIDPGGGELAALRMLPLRLRRIRLERVPQTDAEWLRATIERISCQFRTCVVAGSDDLLVVHPRRREPADDSSGSPPPEPSPALPTTKKPERHLWLQRITHRVPHR